MSACSETRMQKKLWEKKKKKRTVLCQYLRGQGASLSPRIALSSEKPRGRSFQNQHVAVALSDNPVWPRLPMEHGWRECGQNSLSAQWEMLHQALHIPSTLPAPGCLGIRGAWRKEDVWPIPGGFDLGWDLLDHTAPSNVPHCSVCAWNTSLSLSQICTDSTWSSYPLPSGRRSELTIVRTGLWGTKACILYNFKL